MTAEQTEPQGEPAAEGRGDAGPGAVTERPTGIRWMVFGLSCGTSWFLYLHRYSFALIKPQLKDEFGLTETQLGGLDAAFSTAYSLAQVPTGVLCDVLGAHLFLGIIIIAWSLALGLHAWAGGPRGITTARVLFGLTQAGCYPTLSKVSQMWFPRPVRTSLQGWIASFFGRMGGASSNLLLASVLIGILAFDWRTAINVFVVAGVLWGIVFLVLYRNSARQHYLANEAEARLIEQADIALTGGVAPAQVTFRQLIARTTPRSLLNLLALLVQQFTSTFADAIYVAWIPFFLKEEHGLTYGEMGFYSALPLVGGAIGGTCGGMLNDVLIRVTGNRRWSRSAVGFVGKAAAAGLVMAALAIYDQPFAFCWILFFVKFFSDWSQPTVWGTVTDIGGAAPATAFGLNNMVGGAGGLVSPVVFGAVAQHSVDWKPVFLLVAGAYLISSLSWLLVDCTIPLNQPLTPGSEEGGD